MALRRSERQDKRKRKKSKWRLPSSLVLFLFCCFIVLLLLQRPSILAKWLILSFFSKDRIHAGKSKLEEFTTNAKSSDCLRKVVEGIEVANKSKVATRLSGKGVGKKYP